MHQTRRRSGLTALCLLSLSMWIAGEPVPVCGQTEGRAAIKTESGFVVVWNDPDIHFTVELKGKNVLPMNSPSTGSLAFSIDGTVLQIQSVAIHEFLKKEKRKMLTSQAILVAHQNWEADYLRQSGGAELIVTTLPSPANSSGELMLWKFVLPRGKRSLEQIYVTTVSGSHVIILNGVVSDKNTASEVQRVLLASIASLQVSARPIDLLKLRESLRKNSGR